MNIITDKLPDVVEIEGVEYPIYTDFRIWIKFELLLQSEEPKEKIFFDAIKLCFKRSNGPFRLPPTPIVTLRALFSFYSRTYGSEPEKDSDTQASTDTRAAAERIYSFNEDADYIYAAFREQYGIDLSDCDMHWWQFRALFAGIGSNTKFGNIMSIRAVDLSDISDKKQRSYYKKLKRLFALDDNRSEEQRENDMADMFW